MGKDSAIEWTHHTFNPWWGCVKVSPGCKHCYAETFAYRIGRDLWGARAERRFFSDAHWQEPRRWNAAAERLGVRQRVFCASMSDVFEPRRDLDAARERLWRLISETTALDWLLLTKRPDRVERAVPWGDDWPVNVWLGVTAENQLWAQKRIPLLIDIPAKIRFLSCEPLISALDLSPWLAGINWVIAGGESGHKARPMNPDWVRAIRDQCKKESVPFHFKQWGNWRPAVPATPASAKSVSVDSARGGKIKLVRLTKRAAGRDLDGRTWNDFPSLANSPRR